MNKSSKTQGGRGVPTKSEVLNNLAAATNLSRKEVGAVLEALTADIRRHICRNGIGVYKIPGLCEIMRVQKPARPAREETNPRTGEKVKLKPQPARTAVKVFALRNMKDMVGSGSGLLWGEEYVAAEDETARILGVTLAADRGYDAIETRNGIERRLLIAGRCDFYQRYRGQPLDFFNVENEWDAALMVLLDENLEAVEIYEAERAPFVAVLTAPGSKAGNRCGVMTVSKFKQIGTLRWRKPATADAGDADLA